MEWFTMENPFVQKQNMTLARGAFRQQQLNIQTDAVVTWLNMIFPGRNIRNSDTALIDALKDGSLLCELLAKIAPETGVKVATAGKVDFIRLENVGAYLRAVATIGVRNLFDASDLFEGRIFKILSHLLELGEVAKKRGFKPCVGDRPEQPVASTPRSAAASSSAAEAAAEPISEAELELEETELDEENLQEFEKVSEEMQARLEEAKKEAAQEAERKRVAAEEEARKLKEELEKMRIEKENLARELNQSKVRKEEPTRLPFGNTEVTQGDKDCFMGKYMEDGPPGRLTIIVVSIEGISVVEPFSEEVIFSALWRRIKSWGINYSGDMFKLDYLPLRSTDETIVAAWFACQNGSKLLDSIMKWISRKKEQLQQEQAQQESEAPKGSNPNLGPRKPSLLKRMVGKGK